MNQPEGIAPVEEEFEFRELIVTLWDGKGLIAACMIVGGALAITYALMARNVFRSEALVQPREHSQPAMSVIAAELGGLAGLAGVSGSLGGDRAVAIATIKSRALIETMIQEKRLLPRLYENMWDDEAAKWMSEDPRGIPTTWQAYNRFSKDILKVTDDKKTGLLTVAVEWTNPEEAQQWTAELIARTNSYLKAKAIEEAERNLEYLQEQSERIGKVKLQQALYNMVETEMKKLMLARGGEEFALKTIDAAVVPRQRIRPVRRVIALSGVLLGGLVGAGVVMLRRYLRREATSSFR